MTKVKITENTRLRDLDRLFTDKWIIVTLKNGDKYKVFQIMTDDEFQPYGQEDDDLPFYKVIVYASYDTRAELKKNYATGGNAIMLKDIDTIELAE